MGRPYHVLYEPDDPPSDPDPQAVVAWAALQFRMIRGMLTTLATGYLEETFAEPAKRYTGMLRLADGTEWDPGAGRGVYYYDEGDSAWHKL